MWLSAATSARRSISGVFGSVFFSSVVSALIIWPIAWSVFRGSFSEDSTSAHCSNFRFSRLFISSLSHFFSWIFFSCFLSTTSFLRRSPRIWTPLWRNPQLYWKGSLSRGYCCFGQFYAEVIFYRLNPHTKCSVGDTKTNKFYQGHLP